MVWWPVLATCGGWFLTVVGFLIVGHKDSKKEVKESASETQAIMTKLDFMQGSMAKIENKVDTMTSYNQSRFIDIEKRLTKVEVMWGINNGGKASTN